MSVGLLSSSSYPGLSASGRQIAELHAVSNRLWHDYRLLRCVARASASDTLIQTALENSFALHLARLYAFLFPEARSSGALGAEDFLGPPWYGLRPLPSALLVAAAHWAERRVGSLAVSSYHASEELREWTLLQASLDLQGIMDPFVLNTPRALLGAEWKVRYADGVMI